MLTKDNTLGVLPEPGADAGIIDRIRYLIRYMRKTQAQFGALIDVDPANMSKIMGGKIRITDRIINRIVVNLGVSKPWLTEGEGSPFGEPVAVVTPETGRAPKGAPVYDIDVVAGTRELSRMFTDEHVIGYLDLPDINPQYPIVRANGDSMVPKIANGGFVQIRPISDMSPIFWGNIYVVVLDDYRLIKVVRRHPDRDKVILHSINPEYDDMEVDRLDIRKLYLVERILNFEILT